jgi:tRNA U34 5-methylaminomethyl-2-thiouridine-forming methyltransferase MnmC
VSPDPLNPFNQRYQEHYGSRYGARQQAQRVFVGGSGVLAHDSPRVLEIGFGLGLNFRTTLEAIGERPLDYHAFEAYPLSAAELAGVAPGETHPLWAALLEQWDQAVLAGHLDLNHGPQRLRLDFADATTAPLQGAWAHAIYLDGFSPANNPELWTPDFLARLAGSLAPGGKLATYSAAGAVRRGLITAGLSVQRLHGLRGKREFLVAERLVAQK